MEGLDRFARRIRIHIYMYTRIQTACNEVRRLKGVAFGLDKICYMEDVYTARFWQIISVWSIGKRKQENQCMEIVLF